MDVFVFALLQTFLTVFSLLLQCSTLPMFLLHAPYRNRVSPKMMLCIGLFDILQLLPMCIFTTAFVAGIGMSSPVERFSAALNILGFDALIVQHLLLALNRFITVIRSYLCLSNKESKCERTLFRALNWLLWTCFLGLLIQFQTPLMGGTFDPSTAIFQYNLSLPYSDRYRLFEFHFLMMAVPGASICLYLAIIVVLKRSRGTIATVAASGQRVETPLLSVQERRVLLQSAVLFSGMLLICFTWYFSLGELATQLCTFFYIAYCGLNPALYLAMDVEFRRRFLRLYRISGQTTKVAPVKIPNLGN